MPKSTKSGRTGAKKDAHPRAKFTPEYEEYLERYQEFGEGRPRLTPDEFDKLDDELLDLLDQSHGNLSDEQAIRVQELEYLLIDSE